MLLSEYSQLTKSPFLRESVEKLLPVVIFIPFTLHWKCGAAPPFESELLNTATAPEQKLVVLEAIENTGSITGLTRRITVSNTIPPAVLQAGATVATQINVSLFAKLEAV